MNRRHFIHGAAGLAAWAIAGPTLAKLDPSDRERLEAQLQRGGLICGQTFLLEDNKTIVLMDLHRISFVSCDFIWPGKVDGYLVEIRDSYHLDFTNCLFDARGGAEGVFHIISPRRMRPDARSYRDWQDICVEGKGRDA